jgi:hypothetical protein
MVEMCTLNLDFQLNKRQKFYLLEFCKEAI